MSDSVVDETEWQDVLPTQPDEDSWIPPIPTQPDPSSLGQEESEPTSTFDLRYRRPFEGLAYLGHLEGRVDIPYHSFIVRTLKAGEKIKIAEMIQALEPSIAYPRAYKAAVAAAGLVLVDGKPLLAGARHIDVLQQKYQYIIEHWYDWVIDLLYEKINELEGKVLEVLQEMGVIKERKEVVQTQQAEVADGQGQ